jgi:alpha-N-arabinofuranosidase
MAIESGAEYRFSAYVRTSGPKVIRGTITEDAGHEIGSGALQSFNGEWNHYETVIRATATSQHARLNLILDEPGQLDLDMVSLFPVDTWKRRPNGLRKDLVQLLADMHPGFLRFPGGCIVEGRLLATRYRWKNSIGDIAQRKTIINRWNDEFDYRPAPDYFQSFGLGFYEYFQLAEDIGAQPLPILNCGMACQFNTDETAALDQLDEYIKDALDLIEFANGSVTSPWGKIRADLGHPEPFHLTMIGVGNEQWGPRYVERYKLFAARLKADHPEIRLVVSAGPAPSGEPFNSLWATWRELHADIVDEHYYMGPDWFLSNTSRYDHYDRSGPKVFAGEYAAQTVGTTSSENRNNWKGAIAEAAFMTGLERNGDVVQMASYAPLLANVEAWQWKPDAIWFDNLHSYGTPNYYVPARLRRQRRHPHRPRHTPGRNRPLHQRHPRRAHPRAHRQGHQQHALHPRSNHTVEAALTPPERHPRHHSLQRRPRRRKQLRPPPPPSHPNPQPSTAKSSEPSPSSCPPYSLTVYRIPAQ